MSSKFCKECGKEIGEGLAFCPSCGTSIPASPSEPAAAIPVAQTKVKTPREPMKRKTKVMLSVIVALGLLVVGTHFILTYLNDSTKQLKRIHNAIIDEDSESLFKELAVPENAIYVKDSFTKSLHTTELTILFEELTNTVDQVKNTGLTEVVSDSAGIHVFRVKYGKRFYLYPTVLIEPVAESLVIDTDLTDTTVVIADQEFELTGEPLTITNVLPDSYTLTLKGKNSYVESEDHVKLDRSSFRGQAELSLPSYAYSVQFEGTPMDSIVYVNGKSTEKSLAELSAIVPVFGEGATFHAVRTLDDGKTEKSEEVIGLPGQSVAFTYPLLVQEELEAKEKEEAARLEQEQAKADQALIQEAADTYYAFRNAYENALNYRDVAYIVPYLNSDKSVYAEMMKFITDIDPGSYYVYAFLSNEVVDAEVIGDIIHLQVREKFTYTDEHETLEYDRIKRYEFEKDFYNPGLHINAIHIEDTNKSKS